MGKTTWLADDAYTTHCQWMATVSADESMNEDTTRTRIIDAILFDTLRWDRNFVATEKHVEKEGFADYVFSAKGGTAMVLEAKRIGSAFTLPTSETYPSRPVPFEMIADTCPDAHKAMQQAVTYANSVGARYTAISNGTQWLMMLTLVEGTPLKRRSVIVFESLQAIKEKFPLFWDCFSPLMVEVNKPYGLLLDVRRKPASAKLAQSIAGYPVTREGADIRNEHATSIQYIWEEVNTNEGTPTFFEECYVPPVGHDKNRGLAKQLLSDRAARDAKEYERVHAAHVPAMLKESANPERPIVLLGRIGHGKSTFITYLKEVAAADALANYIQLDVNFLDLPRKREEVADFVYGSVKEQLKDRYGIDVADDAVVRASLAIQLFDFRKTPRAKAYLAAGDQTRFQEAELDFIDSTTKDDHGYLKCVVQHLRKGRKKSIAVFFDNLDKRAELQEEAFLVASAIARDWAAMTFICLRPGTFQRSRDLGVLDSIAPRLIEVHSPPIALFLKRRLEYAASIAAGEKLPPKGSDALSKSIAQDGEALSGFFMSMSASFQRDRALTTLFDAIANGNLREVLTRVGAVMTSWHLNTTEILAGIRTTGAYYLTHHQAMRAMLYGASHYFDPELSPLVNLFDTKCADPVEHFLRPICLLHLTDLTHEVATQGFTAYADIAARVGSYSFTPDQVDESLRFLFAKRLIEDENFSETWPGTDAGIRLSALGRYHITDLIFTFAYLDAIVVDTPILDGVTATQIKPVEPIEERLKRGRLFLRYMHKCAQSTVGTPFYTHWDRVHTELAGEITDIENKLSARSP